MKRLARFGAVLLAVSASGVGPSAGYGQAVFPSPPMPASPMVSGDLNRLVRRMGDEVRDLGETVANDLGDSPQGRRLLDDTRELAQAVNEFQSGLRNPIDRSQAVQAYYGIDTSWHHLLSQLSRTGVTTGGINQATRRVAETDATIHRALAMNDYPAGYYGGNAPLSGTAELQRLTHALADRAEALAAVARVDLAVPGGERLIQEAVNLAQGVDTYHDALNLNGPIDATAQNGFSVVAALSDRLQTDLGQVNVPPRVRNAWQAYNAAEVLVRQTLGLPNTPDDLANTVLVERPGGGSQVAYLSDQLVRQVADFLQVFSQTAAAVPEGQYFLADAQALQAAAADFRNDAGRGLNPSQLAYEFRDVDALWQRLARRTNRISRGRTGPNIQKIEFMGQTVAEIHRLLAIPGYAPVLNPLP